MADHKDINRSKSDHANIQIHDQSAYSFSRSQDCQRDTSKGSQAWSQGSSGALAPAQGPSGHSAWRSAPSRPTKLPWAIYTTHFNLLQRISPRCGCQVTGPGRQKQVPPPHWIPSNLPSNTKHHHHHLTISFR